jgi:hypothetical protein
MTTKEKKAHFHSEGERMMEDIEFGELGGAGD